MWYKMQLFGPEDEWALRKDTPMVTAYILKIIYISIYSKGHVLLTA
jgi:hypothetical protein